MSRNPQYVEVEDDVMVEKHHHNHYGYSRSAWFAVACFAIFLVVVILIAVLWPYTVTTTQSNAMSIHSLNEKLAAQHRSDFETEGMYSLSRAFHTHQPHTLALCHMGLYRTSSASASDLRVVQDAGLHVGEKHGSERYYVVKAHFNIQFNVDALSLSGVTARKLQQQLQVYDEHYQLVHYEMASSFTDFSTVRLIESELDVHKNQLKVKREFIACSNNPSLDVKRCHNLVDGLMAMNNTRLVTMDNPTKEKKQKKDPVNETAPATVKAKTVSGKTTASELESDQGVDLTPEVKESLKQLKNEITHLRMYHIQFYHAEKGARDSDSFKETLILTVEPSKC